MPRNFTFPESVMLFVSFKTGVGIMQEADTLVATCLSCRGDIYWMRAPDEYWYCSEYEIEKKCKQEFKRVPIEADNSVLRIYKDTTESDIREWLTHWIQEPYECIEIGFTK